MRGIGFACVVGLIVWTLAAVGVWSLWHHCPPPPVCGHFTLLE